MTEEQEACFREMVEDCTNPGDCECNDIWTCDDIAMLLAEIDRLRGENKKLNSLVE